MIQKPARLRSVGPTVLSRPLAVALTVLFATSLVACGRSGLRGLGDSPLDGGGAGSQGQGGGGGGGAAGHAGSGVDGGSDRAGSAGDAGADRPPDVGGDTRPDMTTDVPADGKRVVGLAVAPSLVTLSVGGTANLTATLSYSDGTTSDATASAMWSSGDGQVVMVRAGRVTALRAGKVLVTAASGGFTSSATVVVMQTISLVGITIDPALATLPIGAARPFTVTGLFSDGSAADVTAMAKWTTDAPGVLSVDANGVATALGAGSATLFASVATFMAKALVTVPAAMVVQVSVQPPVGTAGIGTRVSFTANATLSDGSHADVTSSAMWSLDDATVGVIDGSGVATGKSAGKSVVRASFGGQVGTAVLVVTPATLKTLEIDPIDPIVGVNVALSFTATGILSDGTKVDLTSQVMWASSSPGVLPIDGTGHAFSKSVGTSVVSAVTGGLGAKSTVTVTAASLKNLTVSPVSATLAPGSKLQLRATGTFSDGSVIDLTDSVTWTVSPSGFVSVSNAAGSEGVVTALMPGMAAVTATSGTMSATAAIVVSPATLQTLEINPPSLLLPVGASAALMALGHFSDNSTRDVTKEVAWASTDDATATVGNAPGAAGLVTGVKAGAVTVTATQGGVAAKATVIVAAATLQSIIVSPANATTTAGLRSSYSAMGVYSDGSKLDVTARATWSTGDAAVATISNVAGAEGQLLARAAGTTAVTASLDGVSGQTNVTVTGATPSSLSIAPIAVSTPLGTAVQYTATLIFSNGTTRNVTGPADWTSSNPMAATINGQGRATPVAMGATTITATYMGLTASTTLTVTAAVAVSVEVTPIAPMMPVGTVTQFTATAIFSDGSTRNVTGQATWVSTNPGVVGVVTNRGQRGRATAVAKGTAVITATYMGLSGETTVTVTDAVIVEISVSPAGVTMPVGSRRQFTAQAIRSDGTSMAVTGAATWQSDTPSVAAVSTAGGTRGQVTGVGGGTATISATYMGVTGSVKITITPATLTAVQVTPFKPTSEPNAQLQFQATALFSDGTSMPVTGLATWQSSDDMVAGISNAAGSRGLATTLMKGMTTISATYMNIKGSTVLQVTDATVVQIQITPFDPTIPVTFQQQLTATAIYSDGTNRDITSIATWSSLNIIFAVVSDAAATKGLVTTFEVGRATIKAQYGGVAGTADVTIAATALKSIAITPANPKLAVGATQALAATGTFDDGSTLDLTALVTWTSTNLDVADVSNADGSRGEATAFGAGTTTVQAQRGAVTTTTTLTVN